MSEKNGLVFAFNLDGKGGGETLDFAGIKDWTPGKGSLWVHLNYTGTAAKKWLHHESGIDPIIVDALTAEETRPRSLVHKGGMLVILRGVNLSPKTDPEDMISIRFWIDANRIVTMRNRPVMAIDDLRQAVIEGQGPTGPSAFLVQLANHMSYRMGDVVADVDDAVDALEDEVLNEQNYELRQKIANLRRTAIGMRRYLAPQRDMMNRLYSESVDWLDDNDRMRLRETSDRTTRYVEDLDAVRDRATVTHEELNNRLAEQMNKTMYILSIVTGIFLPLGLLTGLFGINVGGIPGMESRWAFTVFCGVLVIIAICLICLFKRKKWM
ncbi:MAG: zinc transporter ZntB [Kiritimatiellae bacterium]|nr:zinc transporter ZntB [Kiritimatiellia bacterium]